MPDSPDNKWWWGFHVLAGVGIDDNHGIIFADPDTTKFTPPDPQHPSPGFCPLLAHCTDSGNYIATDQFPLGDSVGAYYQEFHVDQFGVVTDGIYEGASIQLIVDISPVPEPSTLALMSVGFAGIVFGLQRQRHRRWINHL